MTSVRVIASPDNNKIEIAHAGLADALTKGFRTGAYISGKQLVKDLRDDMMKPKSGRSYRIYQGIGGKSLKQARLHIASSGKETPAIRSGDFRKSVDFLVRGTKQLEFGSGANGFAEKYSKFLEEGTSKMEARKPIGRTVEKLQFQVKENIVKNVNKSVMSLGFNVKRLK